MKVISKFYDCIDYLNDYQDSNVFVRNDSCFYIQSNYAKNNFRDRIYNATPVESIQYILSNKLSYVNFIDQDHIELYGKFVFLPNRELDIPVKLLIYDINSKQPQLKIESYYAKNQLVINSKLDKFINTELIPQITVKTDNSVRNQPVWFLIFDNVLRNSEKHKTYQYDWYYNNLDWYNIWFNFPLYRIEHLFKVQKEQIYQDIELYLWHDNNIDTMKNISDKDRIVQHGYDIKTSFRNCK